MKLAWLLDLLRWIWRWFGGGLMMDDDEKGLGDGKKVE
jgi:hypothetical protein